MPALGAGGRWFESGRPHLFQIEFVGADILSKCKNVKLFQEQ
jgi:hypothetical protein